VFLRDNLLRIVLNRYFVTRASIRGVECNHGWRNSDHFSDYSNFEQSLLKMVTRRKRSSTTKASGWPEGQVWWSKSREEP